MFDLRVFQPQLYTNVQSFKAVIWFFVAIIKINHPCKPVKKYFLCQYLVFWQIFNHSKLCFVVYYANISTAKKGLIFQNSQKCFYGTIPQYRKPINHSKWYKSVVYYANISQLANVQNQLKTVNKTFLKFIVRKTNDATICTLL